MATWKSWRARKPEEDNTSVYISEKFGVRTLHIGSDTVQSSMRLSKPNELEVAYTRSMMAFLLFNPAPREVLMVGLGGGSLAKFIYHRLPQTEVVAVEINPQVVQIARQFFQVPEDDDRFQIVIGDGAAYMEENWQADVIMVDGYDAEAQVKALATLAFYRHCARVLGGGGNEAGNEAGILVVNLWGGDREFNACVERIAQAFDGRVLCLPAGKPGNVVVLAFTRSPGQPTWAELKQRAQALEQQYPLPFTQFVEDLRTRNTHDERALLI